jgi:hypothetical protein
VLKKGQPSEAPEQTLTDRYGEVVRRGDLVVIGRGGSGTLLIGNVTKINENRSVKVKVIGASEEAQTSNMRPEQILKLDNEIFTRLMMAKLSAA